MTKHFIFALILIVVLYGLKEAWPLIAGPTLSIDSPANHTSFPGGIVTIRGEALRAAQLTLNGAALLREENGSFSSTLSFPSGGSILTFTVTDRFGRHITKTHSIFVP